MARFVVLSVFTIVCTVQVTHGGTVALQHRDTTLDELKSIDSYVSSALPVLHDGFFIGTPSGPVLVKSDPNPGAKVSGKPTVNKGYYNTLPRLIPAGLEGIAVSHFNLGAATPYQPFRQSKEFVTVPAPVVTQLPQAYVSAQPVQQTEQFISQPDQSQHVYVTQQPQQQYFTQHHHHQPQQFLREVQYQRPQQFATEGQHNPQQFPTEVQQFPQQYVAETQQPQQYIADPQQHVQYQESPQQYILPPSQHLISEQPVDSQYAAQEATQITARRQPPTPLAHQSFQNDNLLRQEHDNSVSSYQTQVFGAERFHSQKLLPNAAVLASTDFEDTLPDPLKNRFYKNANLATILAQESLPVQGEQIIGEWDTNKITKSKIHALLHGAGLI